MATVTTASVDNGVVSTWDRLGPGRPVLGAPPVPLGEVIFSGSETIPALGAGDENAWTLQLNFPRNFAYRMVDYRIVCTAAAEGDFTDAQTAMHETLSVDVDGVSSAISYAFEMKGSEYQVNGPDVLESFIFLPGAVANDTVRFFDPPNLPSELIVNDSAARIFGRWLNASPTSGAIVAAWRLRALMFDIEQARTYPVHTATPISGV